MLSLPSKFLIFKLQNQIFARFKEEWVVHLYMEDSFLLQTIFGQPYLYMFILFIHNH